MGQQLAVDLLVSPYLKEEGVGRGHGEDTATKAMKGILRSEKEAQDGRTYRPATYLRYIRAPPQIAIAQRPNHENGSKTERKEEIPWIAMMRAGKWGPRQNIPALNGGLVGIGTTRVKRQAADQDQQRQNCRSYPGTTQNSPPAGFLRPLDGSSLSAEPRIPAVSPSSVNLNSHLQFSNAPDKFGASLVYSPTTSQRHTHQLSPDLLLIDTRRPSPRKPVQGPPGTQPDAVVAVENQRHDLITQQIILAAAATTPYWLDHDVE
ncbi:hypothetical protein V493_06652 [Pseudogymnoascus sp. VKM F-4281 (FW-2241)]|nr:hypothetical protein V493_06652 [Pseudogymnoascus sp. VKM F-4281 (FW-2241)]